MFDVIGKRRWFYLLSGAITIPGLIFILLTPFTDLGLQFTIDYTGGTRWEITFKDPNVTPEQVKAVFLENGLQASTVKTGTGSIEIKTEPIGLIVPAPTAAPSAAPSGSPAASGSAASASLGASGSPASASLAASASPASCSRSAWRSTPTSSSSNG